jgi:hypothetical protein
MNPKTVRSLLDQIAFAKKSLFDAKIIRSERLTGEIGEYLAELQFPMAKRAGTTSNKGWDLILPDGNKIQVKTHAKGAANKARWTEVRHIEAFDILLIVVLSTNYSLREIYQVPRDELEKLAKKNHREVAIINWDKLRKFRVPVLNPNVELCFSGSASTLADAEEPDPGEETNASEAWELLTGVECHEIYFAPRIWRTWNMTADATGVFGFREKLVFEYISPSSKKAAAVRNKITLRGLLPQSLGGALAKQLTSAVINAGWRLPERTGRYKRTKGYAKWKVGYNELPHNFAPKYPKGGFPSEQAFYNWLGVWDRSIGLSPTNPANTRLWEFIESVKPAPSLPLIVL